MNGSDHLNGVTPGLEWVLQKQAERVAAPKSEWKKEMDRLVKIAADAEKAYYDGGMAFELWDSWKAAEKAAAEHQRTNPERRQAKKAERHTRQSRGYRANDPVLRAIFS